MGLRKAMRTMSRSQGLDKLASEPIDEMMPSKSIKWSDSDDSREGKTPAGTTATIGTAISTCSGLVTSDDKSAISADSNALTNGFHTNMTREVKNRDIYKYYEVVKVLGRGSMGSISSVRKKREHMGGSARKVSLKNRCLSFGHIPDAIEVVRKGSLKRVDSDATLSKSFMKRVDSNVSLSSKSSKKSAMKRVQSEALMSSGQMKRVDSSASISSKLSKMRSIKRVESDLSMTSIPRDENYECVYALKTINLQHIKDQAFIDELKNEIDILKSLDHPNIIRAMETFEYKKQMCIVMELCSGGDLYARDPYSEEQAARIVRKLLSAISYMHRCGITHRDLKYENILFEDESPDAEIKLVDFGLSKKYGPDDAKMNDSVGTIYTMAPQVLEGDYDCQADLWAIGVVTFMLLSGQLPFFGKRRSAVYDKIMKCEYAFKGPRWGNISNGAKDFISKLLVKDPAARLTADAALSHEWVQADYFKSAELLERDDQLMKIVMLSLKDYASYSKLKKLALMVVAHKSTTREIGFLRNVFEKLDTWRNGTISLEEFKDALSDYDYTEDYLHYLFQGMDVAGSGYVHYTEFLAASLEARGVIVEERLAEAFDRIDADGSGYISKSDLRNMLSNGIGGQLLSDNTLKEIIAETDIKGNGKISYRQFLMLFEKNDDEGDAISVQSGKRKTILSGIFF